MLSTKRRLGSLWLFLAALSTTILSVYAQQDVTTRYNGRLTSVENGLKALREETVPALKNAQNGISAIDKRQGAVEGTVATTQKEIHDFKADVRRLMGDVSFSLNRFWVMLAAVLVFFMQAGFLCLEVGMVHTRFGGLQAMQKLFSWVVTIAVFFPVGFGLMFGPTSSGFLGSLRLPAAVITHANPGFGLEFFLFQAAFAATAVTIPAGATAERMSLRGYLLMALLIAGWSYPTFGHLAWGNSIYPEGKMAETPSLRVFLQGSWFQNINFHDFAGSTVVHSVGGWFALAGVNVLGARQGRFGSNGIVNRAAFASWSTGFAVLGVFMLWFGWWGFNGGSKLVWSEEISNIILNTNLAGAAAGSARMHWPFSRRHPNGHELPIIRASSQKRP